ncbi:MPT51/MPB51 antigen domain protein [Mycobacterium kansasii]|uniref:MPT51/MPB51 antigen domain protein n=1 Tax=Mycobacterium kansasii TaxID=1768 RepID=A0A1V3WW08_MYCKA|nr:MPT51/MPB51 antigen domain protein [Mycobacterium kansasii]
MEVDMRGLSVLLRLLCVAVLSIGLGGVTAAAGSSGTAKAAPYETLMVPSGAMGRDIPVAFLGAAPRGVLAGCLQRRPGREQLGHRR